MQNIAKGGKATPLEMLEQLEFQAQIKTEAEAIFRDAVKVKMTSAGDLQYFIFMNPKWIPVPREGAESAMEQLIGSASLYTGQVTPSWTHRVNMLSIYQYECVRDDGTYAKFINLPLVKIPGYGIAPKGYQIITMNRGYAPEEGVFVCIERDGGTRKSFYGVIDTEVTFKLILNAVR